MLDRDGEYQRLGESRARRTNLQVVAATNRPVEALKHDFLARFSQRVEIPGLLAQCEDIPLLLAHLLSAAAAASPSIGDRFFERRAGAEPRIAPQLIELERLMWVALSSSADPFVALTPQVSAELRAGAVEPTDRPAPRSPTRSPSRPSSGAPTSRPRSHGHAGA